MILAASPKSELEWPEIDPIKCEGLHISFTVCHALHVSNDLRLSSGAACQKQDQDEWGAAGMERGVGKG